MKTFRIIESVGAVYVLLQDDSGKALREGKDPRKLSRWAFDNGADEVRHDYHLRTAEDRQNR